jgi:branched-chain amino acid transport system permease protein
LVLVVATLLRTRWGLGLAAVRNSERGAESVGVDAFVMKRVVYVIAGCGTGLAGAVIYVEKARISPDAAFSLLDWTAYVIFIVIVGGIGTIEGPIVGVLVFYVLQTYLASYGSAYLILLGDQPCSSRRTDFGVSLSSAGPYSSFPSVGA